MRTKSRLFLLTLLTAFCAFGLSTAAILSARNAGKETSAENEAFVPDKMSLNGVVVFRVGTEDVASYRFGGELAKPILWPLLAPNHKEVTRAWPMRPAGKGGSTDHKHHVSAWFTYGDVIPEGMAIKHKRRGVEGIDFWAEEPGCGRTVALSPGIPDYYAQDKNDCRIASLIEWRTAEGEKIMDESRLIRFFNYTTARLIVVDILLRASVVPITFGDTKEGAFAVRVADSMTEKAGKGRITNAEGKVGEKQCWGRISAWCDYSGPVDGETVGIAIFASPENPVPSCWHCRSYGLMAANPFGRAKSGFPDMKDKKDRKDLVHLKKDELFHLRYGIFLHRGDVNEGKVAEAYELFKKIK